MRGVDEPTTRASEDSARRVLREIFGYESFRGDQRAIIAAAEAGRDTLVLMPTGGGKSLCYQIPALLRCGRGIVVSPLIALMEDQVGALRDAGVRAAFLNSTLSRADQQRVVADLKSASLQIVYVGARGLEELVVADLLRCARAAHAGADARAARGIAAVADRDRRGSLRIAVGARLLPRLSPRPRSL